MGAIKDLQIEAVEAFHKHEDGKMIERITVALTPLADMHTDLWVEAYMLGYENGVKSQYLPSNKAASCGEVLSTKEEK